MEERVWECVQWPGMNSRHDAALVGPEAAVEIENHSRLVRGQLRKRPGLARFAVKDGRLNALYQAVTGGAPVLLMHDGDRVQALGGPDRWVGPGERPLPEEWPGEPSNPWEPPGDEPDAPGKKPCCHYGNVWGVGADVIATEEDLYIRWRPADGYTGQDSWDSRTGQPYPFGEKPQYYEVYLQYCGETDWTGWCTPDAWLKVLSDTRAHALALPEQWPHVVDVGQYGDAGVAAWKWQLLYQGKPVAGVQQVPYELPATVAAVWRNYLHLDAELPQEQGGVVGMTVRAGAEERTVTRAGADWVKLDVPFAVAPAEVVISGEQQVSVTERGTIHGDHGEASYEIRRQFSGTLEEEYWMKITGAKGAVMSAAEWAVLLAGGSVPRVSVFPVYASGWGGCGESAQIVVQPTPVWRIEEIEITVQRRTDSIGNTFMRTGNWGGSTGDNWHYDDIDNWAHAAGALAWYVRSGGVVRYTGSAKGPSVQITKGYMYPNAGGGWPTLTPLGALDTNNVPLHQHFAVQKDSGPASSPTGTIVYLHGGDRRARHLLGLEDLGPTGGTGEYTYTWLEGNTFKVTYAGEFYGLGQLWTRSYETTATIVQGRTAEYELTGGQRASGAMTYRYHHYSPPETLIEELEAGRNHNLLSGKLRMRNLSTGETREVFTP